MLLLYSLHLSILLSCQFLCICGGPRASLHSVGQALAGCSIVVVCWSHPSTREDGWRRCDTHSCAVLRWLADWTAASLPIRFDAPPLGTDRRQTDTHADGRLADAANHPTRTEPTHRCDPIRYHPLTVTWLILLTHVCCADTSAPFDTVTRAFSIEAAAISVDQSPSADRPSARCVALRCVVALPAAWLRPSLAHPAASPPDAATSQHGK